MVRFLSPLCLAELSGWRSFAHTKNCNQDEGLIIQNPHLYFPEVNDRLLEQMLYCVIDFHNDDVVSLKNRSKVTVNIQKNRLVITLSGTLRKADIEGIYTDIRFGVRDLKSDFAVITDMRDCRIGYLSGIEVFRRVLSFLQENKVGKVIRITDKKSVSHSQIMRFTAAISGYSPVYVESIEEAEEILADEG